MQWILLRSPIETPHIHQLYPYNLNVHRKVIWKLDVQAPSLGGMDSVHAIHTLSVPCGQFVTIFMFSFLNKLLCLLFIYWKLRREDFSHSALLGLQMTNVTKPIALGMKWFWSSQLLYLDHKWRKIRYLWNHRALDMLHATVWGFMVPRASPPSGVSSQGTSEWNHGL